MYKKIVYKLFLFPNNCFYSLTSRIEQKLTFWTKANIKFYFFNYN
mgnify:CR=1 FL=1